MASKSNPAASLAKWILVPICLFLLGRFGIGPRIGKNAPAVVEKPLDAIASRLHASNPPIQKHDPEAPPASQKRTERRAFTPDSASSETKKDDGPEVEVTVQPANPQPPTTITTTTTAAPGTSATTTTAPRATTATPTAHHRRHHKKASPPASPPAAPKDEGSFGGTDEGAGKSTTTTTGGGDGDGGSTPPVVSAT